MFFVANKLILNKCILAIVDSGYKLRSKFALMRIFIERIITFWLIRFILFVGLCVYNGESFSWIFFCSVYCSYFNVLFIGITDRLLSCLILQINNPYCCFTYLSNSRTVRVIFTFFFVVNKKPNSFSLYSFLITSKYLVLL